MKQTAISEFLGAGIVVALVAGIGGYLYYSAVHMQVAPRVVANAYPVEVLNTEFEPTGVFQKTVKLGKEGYVQPAPVTLPSDSEIGKKDLGSYE